MTVNQIFNLCRIFTIFRTSDLDVLLVFIFVFENFDYFAYPKPRNKKI